MRCEILIIINGTVGVGKSSISKQLASEIAGAISIEGDSLGFVSPANDYVFDAAIKLIGTYCKNGVNVIVFDMFFDNPEKLNWFISQVDLESYVFYLSADEDELAKRIRKRARSRAEAEIWDSKRLRLSQDKMINRGIDIDTTGKSLEEITAKIKQHISFQLAP